MKSLTKLLVLLMVSVSITSLFTLTVTAQNSTAQLTPAQIESVRSNCVTAQVALQRLRDSDLTARTIRGRSYNDINLLMRAFNSRVALNAINAPDLIAVPATFDTTYRSFYDHYTSYATALTEVLNIRCEDDPVRFYTEYLQAEQQREEVEKDVADLQTLISNYEAGLVRLKGELSRSATPTGGGSQ